MHGIFSIVANVLIISGLAILIAALWMIRRLINEIPPGPIRQKWVIQAVLILFFILGYLGYGIIFWNHPFEFSGLIVPGIFFFGAGFVWLTITLTLKTAVDIKRVALLEQENITDPLIGIYNRRYLDRRLGEEFARAKRYRLSLALLVIDVDHFKQVNDTYGHPIGDQVLRYWGGTILGAVRASDIVARYGGDEILIIAPNTRPVEALTLAERIRTEIESHGVTINSDTSQNQPLRVTVSIGVTGLTPTSEKVEQLLKDADEMLYHAKNQGRNCVSINPDMLVKPDQF